MALFTNSDVEDTGDKVKLMTVHAAKGLEFPYVFLCGMNEGVFPTRKTQTLQAMEEERRLAFVAVTRAEKRLYLTEADGRNFDGTPRYPSRFILDVDEGILQYVPKPRDTLIAEAREHINGTARFLQDETESNTFAIGTRVRHSILGDGTVTDVDANRSAYTVQFDGMPTARSISFRVKLEKL